MLPVRKPLVLSRFHTVTDAIRAMQSEHRGVVLVTEDGTMHSRVVGIFTERDVLFRVVDQGRNPATLPLADADDRPSPSACATTRPSPRCCA